MPSLALSLLDSPLDACLKGYPQNAPPLTVAEASRQGWNLFRGELGLPSLTIRRESMDHNRAFLRRLLASTGMAFCPHGKTTLAPQLFRRQIEDGAWGITVANPHQARVAHTHGFRHLTLANQVIHRPELTWIQAVHDQEPDSEIRLLVDGPEGLAALEQTPGQRPFPVLLELGLPGARAGVRDPGLARELARRIARSPRCELRGVECFEALASMGTPEESAYGVRAYVDRLVKLAGDLHREGLFASGEVWITAGGSAFIDVVAEGLHGLGEPFRAVLRSGCYLTHDTGLYAGHLRNMEQRSGWRDSLRPALELWTQVLSQPEPGLCILNAGKRDLPSDAGLPMPTRHARLGGSPREIKNWRLGSLYDQHVQLLTPQGEEPAVGDLVALSPSHPCTAFDRWALIWLLEEDGRACEALRTFF